MNDGDKPEANPPAVPPSEAAHMELRELSVSASFAGPIPSPRILQDYDRILAGSAERILQMAEKQAAHRLEIERQITLAEIEDQRAQRLEIQRGQNYGLVAVITSLALSGVAVVFNQPWVAGVIGGGTLVSLAGAFIVPRLLTPPASSTNQDSPQPK